ncbi:MAG: hypothetical protein ACK521_11660, partial [bacterium]
MDKDNANAYFNRGCCYDSVGELDLAISDYSVALELDMKSSEFVFVNEGVYRLRWNEVVFYV